MKVLIAGASGGIGSRAMSRALSHPQITQVVAFSRSPLAVEHSKLENVLIKDFSQWPADVLSAHADAAGMMWCIGSYDGSETLDFEYPVAFMEAMIKVLDARTPKTIFRYVHLSGKFVRQDQDMNLWWGDRPRKLKGKSDTYALEFADRHPEVWRTRVVKPGGVAHHWWMSPGVWLAGANWAVRGDELGAFMTYLVVDGKQEDPISLNAQIVRKGKELLRGA